MFLINKLKKDFVDLKKDFVDLKKDFESSHNQLFKLKIDVLLKENKLTIKEDYVVFIWKIIFIIKWDKTILHYNYDYDLNCSYEKLYKELKDKIEFMKKIK